MVRKTALIALYAVALMLVSGAVCAGGSEATGEIPGPDFRIDTVAEGIEVLSASLDHDNRGRPRITFRCGEGLRSIVRKAGGWCVVSTRRARRGKAEEIMVPDRFTQVASALRDEGQAAALVRQQNDDAFYCTLKKGDNWQKEKIVDSGRASEQCIAMDDQGIVHAALSRSPNEANYAVRSAQGAWIVYQVATSESTVKPESLSLDLVDGQPRMVFADKDSLHYVQFPVADSLVPPSHLPPAPEGKAWNLVWQDEFSGDKLDGDKWQVPDQRRRDAWWTPRAVQVDGDGHLVIKVFKEDGKYYDGCVRTRNRFEKAFGYFTARIRLQKYPGHWTAFWMWDPKMTRIGHKGMDGTEIDIMEKPWLDERVQHTLHWDGYGEHHGSSGHVSKNPGVMDGWHSFSLLWTPDEYVFYVDGEEEWRTTAGGVCQVPLYLKLSDEVQFNSWAGDIRDSTVPDEFLTDYVRVYDLVDTQTGEAVMKPKDYKD